MRAPRVTLEQWRALQAVVDHGGFAQAAGFLNRSQSSVSYALGKLQGQLGVPLLRIKGRKAELTEDGEAILRRARYLLRDACSIEEFAASLEKGWEPEIRLVVDAAFPARLLMEALRGFKPLSRGSRVQLTQVVMSGADDALEEGWADLVIGGRIPPHYLGDVLLEIEFIAVAHPDHALHQLQRDLTIADLEPELHVVISDSGIRRKRDSGWLPAEHRWTVTNIDNAIEAIRAGLGFSWLPRHRIEHLIQQGHLLPLPLREGRVYREHLYLIYGRPEAPGPAACALADQFRRVVGNVQQ
jgi:DNA-binding transcriptional LysR family regulator